MMKDGGRKIPTKPLSERKDRDDHDLVLFRDLHRREKDHMASLLQPVSDEFEPNPGNYALYRMASGRKGPGYEFFAENEKNDYDWLKTPPATPLFPSLEMEANAPELLIQRDIPVLQPLSRFGGESASTKAANNIGRPKSPKQKPKVPLRSVTPSQTQRPTIALTENKTNKPTSTLNPKTTTHLSNRKFGFGNTQKTTTRVHKDTHMDFLTSNITKNNMVGSDTNKTKPRSRGVSPSTRSTIPLDIPGFSNEAPPNLRTDISRSTSATRGRPAASNSTASKEPAPSMRSTDINRATSATRGRPAEANTTVSRRQSCSPSVTRGRRVTESNKQDQADAQKGKSNSSISIRNNNNNNNNSSSVGTQFLGSRMVDRLMNARSKPSNDDRESTRPKSRSGSVSQVTGSATKKMMSRTSLDVTSRHTESKRDRISSRLLGIVPGKSSTRE